MKNFMTKAAFFKANIDAAKAALETALKESPQAFKAAQGALKVSDKAFRAFLNEIAARLNKEWNTVQKTLDEKRIVVYDQFGGHSEVSETPPVYIDVQGEEFAFTETLDSFAGTLARYNTPEQLKTVIEMFKAAIERGDTEFRFPPVAELNRTE